MEASQFMVQGQLGTADMDKSEFVQAFIEYLCATQVVVEREGEVADKIEMKRQEPQFEGTHNCAIRKCENHLAAEERRLTVAIEKLDLLKTKLILLVELKMHSNASFRLLFSLSSFTADALRISTQARPTESARRRLNDARRQHSDVQIQLLAITPRLKFYDEDRLPADVLMAITSRLGFYAAKRAFKVRKTWTASVGEAQRLGKYRHKVLCVAAYHGTAIVTEKGVYTCGKEDAETIHLHLGSNSDNDDHSTPKLVKSLDGMNPIGAALGTAHTVIWTATGALFTHGWARYGQLGHGRREEDERHTRTPGRVEALEGEKVVGAAAAAHHTAAWTADGDLFTFGWGFYRSLGHGGSQDERSPRRVDGLVGQHVVGAACGVVNTLAWTQDGQLYAMGELLCFSTPNAGVPRLVPGLTGKKVVGASVGGRLRGHGHPMLPHTPAKHACCWTDQGELFTFGDSDFGKLGHGWSQHGHNMSAAEGMGKESQPRLVEGLLGHRVVGASCGDHHTVALTDQGEVYVFGWGAHGRLGCGGGVTWKDVPFKLGAQLEGKKVVQVEAGQCHTILRTENGTVYTFGAGHNGELGHGKAGIKLDPTMVEAIEMATRK